MNIFKLILSKIENILLLSQKFHPRFNNHELGNGIKILIAKQCQMVNAKVIDIDFDNERWYQLRTWTSETEQRFKQWMINWIRNNNKLAKQVFTIVYDPEKCYPWYILQWGWLVKDNDNGN